MFSPGARFWVFLAIAFPALLLATALVCIAAFVQPRPTGVEIAQAFFPGGWPLPAMVDDRWYSAAGTTFDLCQSTTLTSITVSFGGLNRTFFATTTSECRRPPTSLPTTENVGH